MHAALVGEIEARGILDRHDDLCRIEIGVCGGRWIKATGDGLLATFDSPSRAVRREWALSNRIRSELDIEIRAGLHTGESEARGDDIAGMAVHQAARIQGLARKFGGARFFLRRQPRRRFRHHARRPRDAHPEGHRRTV